MAVHFPGEVSKRIPNGQEFAERLSGSFWESLGFPSWPSHAAAQRVEVPLRAIHPRLPCQTRSQSGKRKVFLVNF